jgi:thiamine-phosphate pyrophosphorylase
LIEMTEAALSAAPPDTIAIQLREKNLDARELVELARQLRVICERYQARLLINDRIDVAIASRADGVHLPANSFAVANTRSLLGHDHLIGVSTHDQAEVAVASDAGADFVVYGPVYDPLSKDSYTSARGAEGLNAACAAASIPVFALGGINATRIRELRSQMAFANPLEPGQRPAGIAVIGAIYGALDPAAAMRDLIEALT